MTATTSRRIRPALPSEKEAYDARRPVYPLYGFILLGGRECAVEDLRGFAGSDEPQFEVMAPEGFHFEGEGTHSLLANSRTDAVERVRGESLVPCTERCGVPATVEV